MNSATVICDPLSSKASVQYGLINMVVKTLSGFDRINIVSPFIPLNRIEQLKKIVSGEVLSLSENRTIISSIYNKVEKNEAMLWSASWALEALYGTNSSLLATYLRTYDLGTVINISYTLPAKCRLFWNQATPPLETLKGMARTNYIASLIQTSLGWIIHKLDSKLRDRHFDNAIQFVNNSQYLKSLYEKLDRPSDQVIHVPKEFDLFVPSGKRPTKDYVLTYIGKETEIETLLEMASRGIRMKSFGSKVPFGTNISKLKEKIEFLGYVSDEELADLYYNALFTAFPFTEEPFGWVPLESMHYGTPVLSYGKQGPAETIIDGKTGWLVKDKSSFISKAVELWNIKDTGILSEDCTGRANFFSFERTSRQLREILKDEA